MYSVYIVYTLHPWRQTKHFTTYEELQRFMSAVNRYPDDIESITIRRVNH